MQLHLGSSRSTPSHLAGNFFLLLVLTITESDMDFGLWSVVTETPVEKSQQYPVIVKIQGTMPKQNKT